MIKQLAQESSDSTDTKHTYQTNMSNSIHTKTLSDLTVAAAVGLRERLPARPPQFFTEGCRSSSRTTRRVKDSTGVEIIKIVTADNREKTAIDAYTVYEMTQGTVWRRLVDAVADAMLLHVRNSAHGLRPIPEAMAAIRRYYKDVYKAVEFARRNDPNLDPRERRLNTLHGLIRSRKEAGHPCGGLVREMIALRKELGLPVQERKAPPRDEKLAELYDKINELKAAGRPCGKVVRAMIERRKELGLPVRVAAK